MKGMAKRTALATVASGLVVGLAFLGLWLATAWGNTAQADPGLEVGVDAQPLLHVPNTATSLGSIQWCVSVSDGQQFDVDIYVKDVADLMGFDALLTYDSNVVDIVGYDVKQFLPPAPGAFRFGVACGII